MATGKLALRGDDRFDRLLCDVATHAVIDPPARENDLCVMAELLGLVGEVVRINTNAMPPNQTGREFQKIPLGPRGIPMQRNVRTASEGNRRKTSSCRFNIFRSGGLGEQAFVGYAQALMQALDHAQAQCTFAV